jgi:putative exosortase-associated protein (TIGR04073 family)
MKRTLTTLLAAAFILAIAGATPAAAQSDRNEGDFGRMMHKLGRGVTNIFTCWVEIPRNIAEEWERTDPISGLITGGIKGVGWGFARFATGVYETFTFPVPVPADYAVMMEPEYIILDTWGEGVPGITEYSTIDPWNPRG